MKQTLLSQDIPPTPLPTTRAERVHKRRYLPKGILVDSTFILPAFLLFTVVIIYPVVSSFYYAFTNWNGVDTSPHWIGMTNFVTLLHDKEVRIALVNTLVFTIVVCVIQNIFALTLALALDRATGLFGRISELLRVLFLLPVVVSPLAIGYLFSYVFNANFGLVNTVLAQLHLSGLEHDWLGDPRLALGAVITGQLWQYVGYNMVIFLAGLQTVPVTLYEAASLDGVTPWQRFSAITWPLIAPATTISILLTLLGGLKVFDVIVSMTGGGPGYATESIVLRIEREGFQFAHFGYASAMSLVLSIGLFIVTIVALTILRRRELVA